MQRLMGEQGLFSDLLVLWLCPRLQEFPEETVYICISLYISHTCMNVCFEMSATAMQRFAETCSCVAPTLHEF